MIINNLVGFVFVIFSFFFFVVCRCICHLIMMTSTAQKDSSLSPFVRTWFTDPNVERCKRTNIWMSFLHALISGTLAIYSLWVYSPDIHNDYIGHITWLTYLIGCFSFGYTIRMDFQTMICYLFSSI